MKLLNSIKSYHLITVLLIITIVIIGYYFLKRVNEGMRRGLNEKVQTDSNLVTTTNYYLIPPDSALGRTNTLVMQWKDDINRQMNVVNSMFDSNGSLNPQSVTMIKQGIIQAAKTANPTMSDDQINSVVTTELIQKNLKKDYIKVFLDNVIDLATIIKRALN
jgi:hypothetical protein